VTISQLRTKTSTLEQSMAQIKDECETKLSEMSRSVLQSTEETERKISEIRTQSEKESRQTINELTRQRDLVKMELTQQNEEIEELRRKLAENAQVISKQLSKISELESSRPVRSREDRVSGNNISN
jgi:chromosome segregation ATPase